MTRAYMTFLARSPGGFRGRRGWYLTGRSESILAGPFHSERLALAHAARAGLEMIS